MVNLLASQKGLEDNCKDTDMLPKVNKADMAVTMKVIKEYLRSYCGVMSAPLAYYIRMRIVVCTYGDYPRYAIPDN